MRALHKLIALACVIGMLAGCAKARAPKLEVWTISLRPTFTSYMEGVIQRWESRNPGLQIEWVDLPIGAIQQKLIAALVSGSPPSVVNLNTDMAYQLAEAGALLDLNGEVPPAAQRVYYPGLWDAVTVDGSPYAVPWYVSIQILTYNADLFKRAGLDPDRPPKTWDELMNDAVAIKEKTGMAGWLPSIRFLDDLQEQGIPVLDSTRKKALFDQPAAVAWLVRYVDLFKAGMLPRETLSLSKAYPQAVDLYQSGRLGILQAGPQFLNRVRDNAPSVYAVTRVAPLPQGAGGVIAASPMNLVIPTNAPHRKEAVSFALYLTNDQNQLDFCKAVPIFPSTVKASRDPFFSLPGPDPLLSNARKIGALELKSARDLTLGLKNAKARNEAIRSALENALLGRKTPRDALHEAALVWDELLQ